MNESDAPILSIFAEALACDSPGSRAAHLDRVCGGDAVLRAEIEALLKAHDEAGDFLKGRDSQADFASAADDEAKRETTGTIIGPYKLLEQIGEGGMGVVYMADQLTPVLRRVALKIIKPGMDTRKVIARFEAERQALALMEHPHIAKVLDAGTTEGGRPYFVMELVKGIPITQYCDEHRLMPRQRLELFIPVCEAVQHAHQKGIIHRDLKPTNVLVADYDERPVAKIIDFGVVKAIGQRLTEQTMFTEFGQVVGTIEYMSPEQAKLNQLDIDTRTDVYSLGVLLYELLTGSTPFDQQRLRNEAFDEMLRIIREEEPPKPSTRLSTSGTLSAIAANRGTEQTRLGKIVRGELDWIVMKALDKDRSRRYQTAGALARELQHYLDDEPVEACPPSVAYRLRKFARRNRVVLVTAGLVAAALLAGTAASVSQAIRATTAETLAEARLEAESNAHKEANDARAKAEAIARKARQAVDDMYTQVAEKWLAHQPQIEPVQREFLEKALQYYAEFAKETSTEPVVRLETAGAFRRIAEIQHRFGQTAQAEEAFERAADQLQALVNQFPSVPQYRADLAATLHKLGVLFGDTGRYDQEEKIHFRALALEERLAADFPATPSYRRDLGRGHWFVARVLTSLHRRRDAAQAYRSALTIQSLLVAEFPAVPEYRELLAESHFGLGNVLRNLGRTEEYQQALGEAAFILEQLAPDFPAHPGYRNQLGNVYYWMMRGLPPSKEAEQYLRRALALQEKLVDDFPAVADYRYDLFRSQRTLGWLLNRTNRAEEAENAFRKAVAIADQLIADSPSVHYYRGGLALMYMSLGEFLTENGRLSEAVDAYRQAIVVFERLVVEFPDVPEYGPDLRQSYCNLALLLNRGGQTQEAADVYAKALRVDPHDSAGLNHLAWLLAIPLDSPLRDPEKAIDLAEKAIKLAPERTKYWRTLGAAHYRAGNWKEAVAALEKAKGPHARHHKFDCCFLAMAHWQLGNREEARKWYAEAAKLTENSSGHDQLQRLLAEAAALMILDSEVAEPDLDVKAAADPQR